MRLFKLVTLLSVVAVALLGATAAQPTSGPGKRLLRLAAPVTELAADGAQAATFACGTGDYWFLAWNPVRRATVLVDRSGCASGSSGISALGVAGHRLAWVPYDSGNYTESQLVTATVRRPRSITRLTGTRVHNTDDGVGDDVGNIYGDGSLLVFNTWSVCEKSPYTDSCPPGAPDGYHIYDENLWRIVGRRKQLLVASPDELTVLAVAAGRILVQRADGSLEIRRGSDGNLVRAFPSFRRGYERVAVLDASELVVLDRMSGHHWRVYDPVSGVQKRVLQAPAGAIPADVERGLLVFTVGRIVHVLRLGRPADDLPRAGAPAALRQRGARARADRACGTLLLVSGAARGPCPLCPLQLDSLQKMRKLVVLVSIAIVGAPVGAAALHAGSAPSFGPARSYTTGRDPLSVAIGDLNGDGKPDLATANANYSGVGTASVLLNRGDGSFRAKIDYRTGRGPNSVASGDLNGDGKPDLATANLDADRVSVLLNRGDGSFQARLDYRTGHAPYSVAIGDLNGDGKPDLATANNGSYPGTVSVFLNRGDGSFQAMVDYATGLGPESVAIGQLNGDGKPDLATANYQGDSVSVLLNSGDGSFQAKRDYGAARSHSVAIGDLNGDGKPDLATANSNGDKESPTSTVAVLLNRGNGSFRASRNYATGPVSESVAIGDLSGDRKPDLATANFGGVGDQYVSALVNRGDGTFQAELDYGIGYRATSVAISDLNGDGKLDLAATGSLPRFGSNVSVLLNRPGLCTVQDVKRQKLAAAKRTIARANCRVGKIRRAYSMTFKRVTKGRVISQRPKPGTVLRGGGKVNLVVSRGKRFS